MITTARIYKASHSQKVITIPKIISEALQLKYGDLIEIQIKKIKTEEFNIE